MSTTIFATQTSTPQMQFPVFSPNEEKLLELHQEKIPHTEMLKKMHVVLKDLYLNLANCNKAQPSKNYDYDLVKKHLHQQHLLSAKINFLKGKINWFEKQLECSQPPRLSPQIIVRNND
jgi:hypothetical protein